MTKLKNVFKEHWFIFLLAGFFCIFLNWPLIRSIHSLGIENFRGVYPMFVDDAEHYITRTQEVLSGHPGLGNAYLAEHKGEPYMSPPLAEIVFAYTAKTLHISVPAFFAWQGFLFPFLCFIFFYFILFYTSKSKIVSLFLALLFFLISPRQFSRPIIQQFIFLPFFLGSYFIWQFYNENKQKSIYVINIIITSLVGLLVYISPYFWSPLFLLFHLTLFTAAFIRKDVRYYFKNLGLSVLIFGLWVAPYLINLFKAVKSPWYAETVVRFGMLNTHWPAAFFNVLPVFICLAALLFIFRKTERVKFYFIGIILLTALAINWQNIITGHYLLFSSHYMDVTIFLVLWSAAMIGAGAKEKLYFNKGLFSPTISIVLLLVVVIFFGYRHRGEFPFILNSGFNKEEMSRIQDMRPVFDWLNYNTERDSVLYLLGGDYDMYYLRNIFYTIYTHNNTYYNGYPGMFLVSNDELLERYLRSLIFDPEANEEFIRQYAYRTRAVEFLSDYQNKLIRNKTWGKIPGINFKIPELIPDGFNDEAVRRFLEIKKQNPMEVLKKYDVDYILLSLDDPRFSSQKEILDSLDSAEPIVEISNILIYKVN